jgi:hypothetical protein
MSTRPGGPPSAPLDDLHARRRELAERVATLHWDLGGLTYEMAIRDHFRLDVIVRKAAELQGPTPSSARSSGCWPPPSRVSAASAARAARSTAAAPRSAGAAASR